MIILLSCFTHFLSFLHLSYLPSFSSTPLFILLLLLLLQHFLQDYQSLSPTVLTNQPSLFFHFSPLAGRKQYIPLFFQLRQFPKSLLFHYLITIRANRQPPRHVLGSIHGCLCHPPHYTRKLNNMPRSQSRSCSRPSASVQALDHPHGLRPLHDPIPTPKQRLYH